MRYNKRMEDRLKTFKSYAIHPWLYRVYSRLSAQDRAIATEFIESHVHLDKGAFELKVNRMFMDKEKPKNYKEILELLTCCNSASGI